MSKLKLLLLTTVIQTHFHSSFAATVALDETLSKAICKQMTDFKTSKTLQPALEDRDSMPDIEGCGWVHWKQCPEGKDCSSFAHKPAEGCQSGGGTPAPGGTPPPAGGAPPPAGGAPPPAGGTPPPAGGPPPSPPPAGGAGPPAGGPLPEGVFKMSMEVDGKQQCYLISSSAKISQDEATKFCKDQSGNLLSIESQAENIVVQAVLGASEQYKNMDFWTDAELSASGKKWKTSGQDFQYTDPSLTSSADGCMTVKTSDQKLLWVSAKCESTYFPFCKSPSACSISSSDGIPVDPGTPVTLGIVKMSAEIDSTPMCYVVDSTFQADAAGAESYCSSKGFGHSVEIESANEQSILDVLLQSNGFTAGAYWTGADMKGNKWKGSGKTIEFLHDKLNRNGDPGCLALTSKWDHVEWTGMDCGTKLYIFCEMASACEGGGSTGGGAGGGAGTGGSGGTGPAPPPPAGGGGGSAPAPSPPNSPPATGGGAGAGSSNIAAGRVHISGSLTRSICSHMKAFQSSKKIQDPLNDKAKFASGDTECNWLHWQQCETRGSCAQFLPKACNEVQVPSG